MVACNAERVMVALSVEMKTVLLSSALCPPWSRTPSAGVHCWGQVYVSSSSLAMSFYAEHKTRRKQVRR